MNFVQGVTSAIQAQIDSKGAVAGQIWTGAHNFVTQALGDISTKVATTQFAMTMQSPAFSGTPTAPTATLGTNTKQLATTEFVTNTAFAGVTQNPTPDYLIMAQGII